ncbi:hypothetical protein SORBI_3001G197800 [Sorghum bicolor]|nr:hypothetical protein SORBI_3001G197800 [Sorghum bicolor]
MTLSSRLVAGVLLVLALALVSSSSSAEERSTGRAASASDHDQTSEATVPLLRPLGLRTPVAAPPPPRSATPRASIRPYHRPSPPPPWS